jgi:hypothetical protein
MDPAVEKSEDRQGIASATETFEGAGTFPRGRQFGSIVTYPDGRGVVLYDGELKWGEWLESRSGVKILLLDGIGSCQKLRYVDESGNGFPTWLIAQRKARRGKHGHGTSLAPSPAHRKPFRLFPRRIWA